MRRTLIAVLSVTLLAGCATRSLAPVEHRSTLYDPQTGGLRGDVHISDGGMRSCGNVCQALLLVVAAGAVSALSNRNGDTCYTGPRGGTYTITSGGNRNYYGC